MTKSNSNYTFYIPELFKSWMKGNTSPVWNFLSFQTDNLSVRL